MEEKDWVSGLKDGPVRGEEASSQRADDLFDREAAELHLRLLFDWLPEEAVFCIATGIGWREKSGFKISEWDDSYFAVGEVGEDLRRVPGCFSGRRP